MDVYVTDCRLLFTAMSLQCRAALVTLAAIALEPMVEFYQQLLGQAPDPYIPNVYAEFQIAGLRLGIFRPKAAHQPEFGSQGKGATSLCLEVENLEAAIAHLTHLGYPPPGEMITASHGREIYAYDPEGNRLILHQSV